MKQRWSIVTDDIAHYLPQSCELVDSLAINYPQFEALAMTTERTICKRTLIAQSSQTFTGGHFGF